LPLWLAACGSGTEAYQDLQSFLAGQISRQANRPVASVACTPHVREVEYDSTADFRCLVRFKDGTSYQTPARIRNPSQSPSGGYYVYSWTPPPGPDITSAPLPPPPSQLSSTSPGSLFFARNLRSAVKTLAAQFHGQQLILALVLYPGALEAVIGANGAAQRVTVDQFGHLAVSARGSFTGSRQGIYVSQLDPTVPHRIADAIAARGKVATARLTRFVLDLSGADAAWDIYSTNAGVRFHALLTGGSVSEISASGTRSLG
jgi:hypothetical protein